MLHSLMTSSSRWLLACAVLIGSAALGTDGFAQMQPPPPGAAPPPQQQAAPTGNPMCQRLEAQLVTIDRGTGTGPGQGRADPPLSGGAAAAAGANSTASSRRPSAWAARVPASSRCSAPVGAMRSGQQPDPADARQSRPDHHQPRAAALGRARRRRPREPAPLGAHRAGAKQLRPAICRGRARTTGPGRLPRRPVRQQHDRAAHRRSRTRRRHVPHRLRAHLRRRLFPGLVRHGACALPR